MNLLHDALKPIAKIAAVLPENMEDSQRLFWYAGEQLTAGDVRRLARLTQPVVPPMTAIKSMRRNTQRRAEEMYCQMAEFIQARGLPPTVREFQELIGVKSTSSACYWLRILAALGWIDWQPRTARSIRIVRTDGAK